MYKKVKLKIYRYITVSYTHLVYFCAEAEDGSVPGMMIFGWKMRKSTSGSCCVWSSL